MIPATPCIYSDRHTLPLPATFPIYPPSINGFTGNARQPAYVATKHGVIGLTRHGALKWARDNIRVNAVCPGVIETPMTDAVARNPDLRRAMEALTPMGRKNGSASSRERGCQYVSITVVAVALINNE